MAENPYSWKTMKALNDADKMKDAGKDNTNKKKWTPDMSTFIWVPESQKKTAVAQTSKTAKAPSGAAIVKPTKKPYNPYGAKEIYDLDRIYRLEDAGEPEDKKDEVIIKPTKKPYNPYGAKEIYDLDRIYRLEDAGEPADKKEEVIIKPTKKPYNPYGAKEIYDLDRIYRLEDAGEPKTNGTSAKKTKKELSKERTAFFERTSSIYQTPPSQYMQLSEEIRKDMPKETHEEDVLDALQMVLDIGGMVPGVGAFLDLANSAISFGRGDAIGAGTSLLSAVPIAGDGFAAGKGVTKVPKVVKGVKSGATKVITPTKPSLNLAAEFRKINAEMMLVEMDGASNVVKKRKNFVVPKKKVDKPPKAVDSKWGKSGGGGKKTGGSVDKKVVVEGNGKVGKLIGSTDGLTVDEKLVIDDLLKKGKNVEVIPTSKIQGEKTPDFRVDGVLTELKTLENHNLNTPLKKIRKALDKQGAEVLIYDMRKAGITSEDVEIIYSRLKGIYGGKVPKKIEFWIQEGEIIK